MRAIYKSYHLPPDQADLMGLELLRSITYLSIADMHLATRDSPLELLLTNRDLIDLDQH